jgi:CSLREA domain-containing protein
MKMIGVREQVLRWLTNSREATARMAATMLLLTGVALSRNAHATGKFHVDSTADLVDEMPGDGICRAADGSCTLRAAVMESNAAPNPKEKSTTIHLPAGEYELTVEDEEREGWSKELDVLRDLRVVGAGRARSSIRPSAGRAFRTPPAT